MTAVDLLTQWAAAECDGDVSSLERLLTDEFVGVGPLGFVLAKQAWMARFQAGLTYDRFELEDLQLHEYGNAAVVSARQIATGTQGGDPLPFEAVQATLTLIHHDRWQLAAIHMSFVAGTSGAPPLPAAARPPLANPSERDERVHTGKERSSMSLEVNPIHAAFLDDDATRDAAYQRLLNSDDLTYADPGRTQTAQINYRYGGRACTSTIPTGTSSSS